MVYGQTEHERDSLKRNPEYMEEIAQQREQFSKNHVAREPLPFMENNGLVVGKKNKSIFRDRLQTTTDFTSEYIEKVGSV